MNPFKDLGNTGHDFILKYRDCIDLFKLPPHVFTIARTAVDCMFAVDKSQTIIVSGESGAGKTEATKQIMRYFAAAKSGKSDTTIQTAILAANPVLEAFGNAKTTRNNNSSRFGRYMQLQLANGGGIEYGSVRNFLLEKSRVVFQGDEERSYHIFYQCMKGLPKAKKEKYGILNLGDYKKLNCKSHEVPGIDDVQECLEVMESFEKMKLDPVEIDSIYEIVSGVMLCCNVELIGVEKAGLDDAAAISPDQREIFLKAANLMHLDPVRVEEAVTEKITIAGGQTIKGNWRQADGNVLLESLAKAMYDKLFDWIIRRLNTNIQPPEGFGTYMGMLDIFGFEVFANNSLEQLFINITNEMLQKNFVDVVFEKEQKLYKSEGVSSADLIFTSNKEVIDMLSAPKASVMTVLEDQCLAPGGTDEKFVSAMHSTLGSSPKLLKAKVQGNIKFSIAHTIGDISYTATDFLMKNNDVLRPELVEIVQQSSNVVCKGMFEGVKVERGKLAKGQLIGSQFMRQLTSLMDLINSTEAHFIRCVKPNENKKALDFCPSKTLIQLHSLSILEALQLRAIGFSYRRPFKEFLHQFRYVSLGISLNEKDDPKKLAEDMCKYAELQPEDYAVGHTMLFMKQAGAKSMSNKQREALAALDPPEDLVSSLVRVQARLRRQSLTAV
eukprot:GHVP01045215.1.p1 GENE.GHVP01045215.1~~GHVP01045215.1.p1  ORF type:complete len:667 (-),score=134.13 GHVP01045215.1:15-2015(-)